MQTTTESLKWINTDRYPIDDLGSEKLRATIADTRAQLAANGCAVVKRTKVDAFVLVKLFLLLPHAGAIEEKPFKTMT